MASDLKRIVGGTYQVFPWDTCTQDFECAFAKVNLNIHLRSVNGLHERFVALPNLYTNKEMAIKENGFLYIFDHTPNFVVVEETMKCLINMKNYMYCLHKQ